LLKRTLHAALLSAFIVLFATSVLARHDEQDGDPYFKIGKNGEVKFDSDIRIGDSLLKKGKYIVQHRIENGDHTFVFLNTKGDKNNSAADRPLTIRSKGVFPGDGAGQSGIHGKEEKDHTVRITKIEIAGENLDHAF